MATKYWIANNPNGEVTDAQVQSLKALSVSDLAEVESLLAAMPVAQAVEDIAVTYTANDAPAAGGSLTVADAAVPTVVELLDYCEELRSCLASLIVNLKTAGVLS